ncbi:MAG: hypothetical protein ACK4FY_07635 [Aquificaceae bacterium]
MLNSITEEQIESLDLETAKECFRLLEHLIKEGERIRNKMAENLVNFRRFKEGYNL